MVLDLSPLTKVEAWADATNERSTRHDEIHSPHRIESQAPPSLNLGPCLSWGLVVYQHAINSLLYLYRNYKSVFRFVHALFGDQS